ncbi:hypothetical protein FHG87_007592 [Trinorchestia longiramus]|nr:hypothetical protein FHG87_007592 [Trinorchestia longiramus]
MSRIVHFWIATQVPCSQTQVSSFHLISLEQKRLRGQLIETYKYLNGFNDITIEGFFDRDSNVRTRNNGHKNIYYIPGYKFHSSLKLPEPGTSYLKISLLLTL